MVAMRNRLGRIWGLLGRCWGTVGCPVHRRGKDKDRATVTTYAIPTPTPDLPSHLPRPPYTYSTSTPTSQPVFTFHCSHLRFSVDLSTGIRRCADCGLVLFIPYSDLVESENALAGVVDV